MLSGESLPPVAPWDALRGLSLGLDLVMGRRPGHAQATALLGLAVGRRLGLDDGDLADVALTALLKDAGCATSRPTFTAHVGTDDIAFHRQVYALDRFTPATFAALLWRLQGTRHDRATGRVANWARPLLGLRDYSQHFARRNAEAAHLAAQLTCPARTIGAVAAVGEHWDGSGVPGRLAGTAIPSAARIVGATQLAAIWGEEVTAAAVADRLAPQAGRRLDPAVVRELRAELIARPPVPAGGWIDVLTVDLAFGDSPLLAMPALTPALLAGVFANIVDAKSPFTAAHSRRVAALAGAMARLAGCPPAEVEAVLLAGLLHDLGKLAIANQILDKPAPLDDDEWAIVRRHPADSARILGTVPGWEPIAAWAAAHHERLEGRGYHRQQRGDAIPLVGRWLAVADAFDAMTAGRPYRPGLDAQEALQYLRAGRATQFDPLAVSLLEAVVQARPLAASEIEALRGPAVSAPLGEPIPSNPLTPSTQTLASM